jgi:hypothetical protein
LTCQVAEIPVTLDCAAGIVQANICFSSVYAAGYSQPDRPAHWLEGAVQLRIRVASPATILDEVSSVLLQLLLFSVA